MTCCCAWSCAWCCGSGVGTIFPEGLLSSVSLLASAFRFLRTTGGALGSFGLRVRFGFSSTGWSTAGCLGFLPPRRLTGAGTSAVVAGWPVAVVGCETEAPPWGELVEAGNDELGSPLSPEGASGDCGGDDRSGDELPSSSKPAPMFRGDGARQRAAGPFSCSAPGNHEEKTEREGEIREGKINK